MHDWIFTKAPIIIWMKRPNLVYRSWCMIAACIIQMYIKSFLSVEFNACDHYALGQSLHFSSNAFPLRTFFQSDFFFSNIILLHLTFSNDVKQLCERKAQPCIGHWALAKRSKKWNRSHSQPQRTLKGQSVNIYFLSLHANIQYQTT